MRVCSGTLGWSAAYIGTTAGQSGMGELAGVAAPVQLGGASGLGRCGG